MQNKEVIKVNNFFLLIFTEFLHQNHNRNFKICLLFINVNALPVNESLDIFVQ